VDGCRIGTERGGGWSRVLHRYRFPDRATARRAIFAWINYNHRRLHSSLGYFPPVEWETHYRSTQADPAA
jgi:transposase InsO family protein